MQPAKPETEEKVKGVERFGLEKKEEPKTPSKRDVRSCAQSGITRETRTYATLAEQVVCERRFEDDVKEDEHMGKMDEDPQTVMERVKTEQSRRTNNSKWPRKLRKCKARRQGEESTI